jgi:hypothetical protein
MKLASRMALIKPSPTLTIQAKAHALKAAGKGSSATQPKWRPTF